MNRLTRFVTNAGCQGTILTGLCGALILYFILVRPEKGDWPLFVAPVLVFFFGAYFLRNVLVDHFRVVRWIMNVLVVLAAATGFVLRKNAPELSSSMEVTLAVGAFMGLYLGCYFWLMSDPRVERENS